MLPIIDTSDIAQELKELYKNKVFREGKYGNTIEIQNAHFLADKDSIIRKPNYEYAKREIQWYESMSLNVNDIPGETPKIWKACANLYGKINSNYGWCIWSDENYNQFKHCVDRLVEDPHTREACMIYTRPSIQLEYNTDNMHDFICTYATQVFLNETEDGKYKLDYTVFMRSCDAVFGYCNDYLWASYVQDYIISALKDKGIDVVKGDIIWNAGSLHIYERHFKHLMESE